MFGKSIAKKIAAQVAKAAPAKVEKVEPASKTPQLSDAINTLKKGDTAGATGMLRNIVGLPSSASAPAPAPAPAPTQATAPAPATASKRFGNGLARFSAKQQTMKSGGKVSSASSRGDGIAQRGKTRGKML